MKSYFLEAVGDAVLARHELSQAFPANADPWVLVDETGDPIAYLNIHKTSDGESEGPYVVQADISGRHHHSDQQVIEALRSLQGRFGGIIRDDHDAVV